MLADPIILILSFAAKSVNVSVPSVPPKIAPVELLMSPDVSDSETTVSLTTSWLVFTPPDATVKVPLFELVPLTTIDWPS